MSTTKNRFKKGVSFTPNNKITIVLIVFTTTITRKISSNFKINTKIIKFCFCAITTNYFNFFPLFFFRNLISKINITINKFTARRRARHTRNVQVVRPYSKEGVEITFTINFETQNIKVRFLSQSYLTISVEMFINFTFQ